MGEKRKKMRSLGWVELKSEIDDSKNRSSY